MTINPHDIPGWPRAFGIEGANSLEPKTTLSPWVQDRLPRYLSTNAGAEEIAFQDWRRFKEAFAPELIERAVQETRDDLGHAIKECSDPFGGSGTTALACQFLNIYCSTIEVNPFLADLIESKLSFYEGQALVETFTSIVYRVPQIETKPDDNPFPNAPPTFVEPGVRGRYLFSRAVAKRIAAYRKAIDEVECTVMQRFFRVMLASILIGVSNAVVSGKGRRYRQRWQTRTIDPSMVNCAFDDACLKAIFQIRRYSNRPTFQYTLIRGDSRSMIERLGSHKLSIFSPPYPNSFDYTDVYNIELWALGYLGNSSANRELRNNTLRSHVQIKRVFTAGSSNSRTLGSTLAALEAVRKNLWDSDIPKMIDAYFDDMRTVLRALRKQIPAGGRVYLVVGDSKYAGVEVPVARILSEEAPELGFDPIGTEPFRSMRASPQQGGRPELPENLLTLRSA